MELFQRHCSLNPRRSAVEVTTNTTYDTTSLRRSQARRNYSLNRTNSVREARATTEDRSLGGTRLSRQNSFSDRSYSSWRDRRDNNGGIAMGLSTVAKTDFSTYGNGRLGRPGYDYAAATRRSGLFDGYTGFAIYSSISQGLDEITYGGRRSRRNSITENTFTGSSLSRRGSFANISDYSAMLAASAAVEAATKSTHSTDDVDSCQNEKEEKKKDTGYLDSNSSKISRQSSVAYDSAFSESSPSMTSKRNHNDKNQIQTAKAISNLTGLEYNKSITRNDSLNCKEKEDKYQLQQRTLSPSSLDVKPASILSRQDSLVNSQSATKVERKVSFNEGPIQSPVQRPESTIENEGKREKRKHKDKEKDKDKEARREERRKRRELKELRKAEKLKESESNHAGENCGNLLKEVSQKLLALEKEQQYVTEDSERTFSPKSQLSVIPPSSLLSGINDERSNQLQILQKQKQQQQEHLREQQRLEQERIDEQKMLHQQQKWLLQNQISIESNQTENNAEEAETNKNIHTDNATNYGVEKDITVKAIVSLNKGNVLVSQESHQTTNYIDDADSKDQKDGEIKLLDSTIVAKQIAQDEIEDSGNGSDPSAASSPTTTAKKDHLLASNLTDKDIDNDSVVLREKETAKSTSTQQEKGTSKRNSLDGKTVQGLAQDLAAECAKAYALMENSLSKFSNDFGPFGITPRNRVSFN